MKEKNQAEYHFWYSIEKSNSISNERNTIQQLIAETCEKGLFQVEIAIAKNKITYDELKALKESFRLEGYDVGVNNHYNETPDYKFKIKWLD